MCRRHSCACMNFFLLAESQSLAVSSWVSKYCERPSSRRNYRMTWAAVLHQILPKAWRYPCGNHLTGFRRRCHEHHTNKGVVQPLKWTANHVPVGPQNVSDQMRCITVHANDGTKATQSGNRTKLAGLRKQWPPISWTPWSLLRGAQFKSKEDIMRNVKAQLITIP